MSAADENSLTDNKAGKSADKWIPWLFVLFFIIVASLDAVFVTIALKTHTGTVTDKAYERGLAYNRTLDEAAAVEALGWRGTIAADNGKSVTLALADAEGMPIDGADVIVKIIRPVQDGHDFERALEGQGGGLYTAAVDFPLPGQWKVRAFVTWQDKQFQTGRTIIVRP